MDGKVLAVSDLIRLPKQYGTALVLMPTLWSLFMAGNGSPPISLVIIFIAGSFLMRSAGCAINDIADRDIDRFVERTKERPLASGRLKTKEALLIFGIFIILSLLLALMLNPLTIILSPIGLLLAVVYPYTKRFIHTPQAVLGIAFGWGAIMAWTAVRNSIGLPPFLILIANIFWATSYDTIYALMDKEDDIRVGVRSTAILFGKAVWMILAVLFFLFVLTLATVGVSLRLGIIFYSSLFIVAILLIRQVIAIKDGIDRDTAFSLFKSHAWIGVLILAGIIFDYTLRNS